MNATFQSSAQVLSIGIFFTLMILGLATTLSNNLFTGLTAHGVPAALAARAAHLPPVSTLFAAFLGYNPVEHLVGAAGLSHLTAAQRAALLGHRYFPELISPAFRAGLHAAFDFAALACLVAAGASWFRGGRYIYRSGESGIAELDADDAEVAAASAAAAGSPAVAPPT